MGKRQKWYAVRVGRQGPKIYRSWPECKADIERWPNSLFKSFFTPQEAEDWLGGSVITASEPIDESEWEQWITEDSSQGASSSSTAPQIKRELSAPERTLKVKREKSSEPPSPSGRASSPILVLSQGDYQPYPAGPSSFTQRVKAENRDVKPGLAYNIPSTSIAHVKPEPYNVTHRFKAETFDMKPVLGDIKPSMQNAMQQNRHGQQPHVKQEPYDRHNPNQRPQDRDVKPRLNDLRQNVPPQPLPLPDLQPDIPDIKLSAEQQRILEDIKARRNVFFTGSAGTGKSVLLREIIKWLVGSGQTVGITASTGIAAVNIGGTTLHSWAGIQLGQESGPKYAFKFLNQPRYEKTLIRWRQTMALIIDEVSMIDGVLFDKLEHIARELRRPEDADEADDRPFGGIQLILSGDFCQLPPVPDQQDGVPIPPTFAFEARSWDACVGRAVTLTHVFRQKDKAFANMLNKMRVGELDEHTIAAFRKLSRDVKYDDGISPTQLFPTRKEVEYANNFRLKQLPIPIHEYQAQDLPGLDSSERKVTLEVMARLLDRLVAPKTITLKIGAQVMLIKNMIPGVLVNGSVGVVTGFHTTQEAAERGFSRSDQLDNKRNGDAKPVKYDTKRVWPAVRFPGSSMLFVPEEFTVNNASGMWEAKRDQVPLILAWALSVHKAQGQTLERVKINLEHTFEKGQAYVALSRATNMDTLQVLGFNPQKVQAHPRVLEWYKQQSNTVKEQPVDDEDIYWQDDGQNVYDEMDDEMAIAAYYQ